MPENAWAEAYRAGTAHAAVLGFALGLVIGSFLNVVIHRLPRMMRREKNISLLVPGSFCPSCGHKIRWHENIPVVSFVLLKGRCSQCASAIGLIYPVVELLTAFAFSASLYRHGLGLEGFAWCLLWSVLIALVALISQGKRRSKDSGPHDHRQ